MSITNTDAAIALLAELEGLDVRFEISAGRLRYSAPKNVMTPFFLQRLQTYRDALIGLIEARVEDVVVADTLPIPVLPRGGGLPLSSAQQRLWFLDQLEGGKASTYNMPPVVLRLEGPLDIEALGRTFNEVVHRHEVLCSAFRVEDDEAVQVPIADAYVAMQITDLSAISASARQFEVDRIVRTQAETPFDLRSGEVLLRVDLMRLTPTEHVVSLTMHHIIGDGWSIGVLVREVSALYQSFVSGDAANLPALPIQYADYAAWERQRLSGPASEPHRRYWKEQLAGAPALLELPTDCPRPKVQRYRGHTEYVRFSSEFTMRLKSFCNKIGITPYMAMLSAYAVLLHRYADQDELVVGTPTSVRPHVQTEGLIGLFLNTLPLRIDLAGGPTFTALLQRVRQVSIGAFEHADLPFEEILKEFNFDRKLEHAPLFQVLFGLLNAPSEPVELEGLKITPMPPQNLYAVYDLVLTMEETAEGMEGRLRGNSDIFTMATLTRMAHHYQTLVAAMVTNPDQAVARIPLIDDDECTELVEWSRPREVHECSHSLIDLFEKQVDCDPAAIALSCGQEHMSYGELNARVNRLAHYLQELGVSADARIGVVAERSLDMVVGLLAVLKAGGAYVPLDPTYPPERLRYMLEDAGIKVLLMQQHLDSNLSDWAVGVQRVYLDDSESDWAGCSDENLLSHPAPEDLAYVIYTSGSTGKPKGVQVEHRHAVRLMLTTESHFGFGSNDVWTLFHSYAFDFSVWELWGALLYGGRLVVVSYAISRSPEQFYELVVSERVTVLNQTPSAFRQFIRADRQHTAKLSLKWVILGGEALELAALSAWVERHGDESPQLINMYGITETTVHASYRRINRADVTARSGSVIGRPLRDLGLYIVDNHLQPVPCGVPGEILVGGGGVARGYLARPELTADRFIEAETCPFALKAGAGKRLYRSGDLARWLPGGDIEYLGRIDQQVKIRGFRIELGEIEAVLGSHPDVAEVVVNAIEADDGHKCLVAYVVPKEESTAPTAPQLRKWANTTLATYMVPAAFMTLDAIPLTGNGKVDRRALPLPDAARPDLITAFVAAETPLQRLITEQWIAILGIERVGLDDNFFELGGNSIKGAIFINRLQQALSCVVYVVALFEAPTVRRLVDYLDDHFPDAAAAFEGRITAADSGPNTLRVDEVRLASFRRHIPFLQPLSGPPVAKIPRAVFVLSPPRSGSTLLRVVLGGHPQLFAPPELELLAFANLAERRDTYTGGLALYLEGTIRALMELDGCDADAARASIIAREQAQQPVAAFYGELQKRLGERILVDKTPSYALNSEILERAEEYFIDPLYIHLHRHPCGMIRSFEKASLGQIFFRYEHDFAMRELAELIWVHSHQTIGKFLSHIPGQRYIDISFEALTHDPRTQVERLCSFLSLPVDDSMLQPYQDRRARMTDGLYSESRMIGDTRFHEHTGIEAAVAENWRGEYGEAVLGDVTLDMAQSLGYTLERDETPSVVEIVAAKERGDVVLPSFAQQRLWFLDQLEGAGTAYTMPGALRIEGPLNRDALLRSLVEIADRHEVLRSSFGMHDGLPFVQFIEHLPPPQEIDLQNVTEDACQRRIGELIKSDAELPFDIEKGPLFRTTLVLLGAESHILLINIHHIVSDGWSIGVLMREWSALYNAFASGQPSPLAPLPIQYADYANWQRQYLRGTELERQLSYWRETLADAPALLELPTDYSRPPVQQYRGNVVEFEIDPELVNALRHIGDSAGASLFMVLLSAFGTLLSRYTGQRDLVIGSPVANRSRLEVENLIGFFVNTIALRLNVDPGFSFRDLLMHTRRVALGAYAHQEISFEQLVEQLKPDRNLSHAPIFQVLFSLQTDPPPSLELRSLEVEVLRSESAVSKYDLTLMLDEREGGLFGAFEYNTDLFEHATIVRLLGHFRGLLRAVSADPDSLVSAISLLTPCEREDRSAWNDTARPLPPDETIHELFSIQANRTPEAIAVEYKEISVSYAELNQRANNLALYLIERGAASDMLIGVCLPRSIEMVVALLGILKSGAAYVPLDPAFPNERLAYIAGDAGILLLVTTTELVGSIRNIDVDRILLDTDSGSIGSQTELVPASLAGADSLAYAIYTSGSTGHPKGVLVEHRSVVNFLESMRREPGLGSNDILLAVTTISFDISVLELYLPLLVGARILLADDETLRDGMALSRLLHRATCLQATPATWRILQAVGWSGQSGFKALCGGEPLPVDLAQYLLGRGVELWNMYGPTETTVWSAIQCIEPEMVSGGLLPIGRPIANTSLHVLDAADTPTPVGIIGELCIGGMGLARGYHQRDKLTAAKFVDIDIGSGLRERLYRTGDRARYRADGSLECLGRMDHQVKIRGFRIELGEIEHALGQHSGVDTCVVLADISAVAGARLVAFFTADKERLLSVDALRESLRQSLPDYMVPTLFVELSQMPLTPNGKIDRRSLIVPSSTDDFSGSGPTSPSRDSLELQLIEIWEDVLGISGVGVGDNFFDLGGHSLVAVRLMARITKQFGQQLPLATLFQGGNIEQLADILRAESSQQLWSSLVPVRRSGCKTPLFCVAGAGGNVVYFHDLARALDRERPFYALQPPGLDGRSAPLGKIEELAAHYIDSICSIQPHGPYMLLGHSFGGLVAFEMAHQLDRAGEEIERLLLLDTAAPHLQYPLVANWDEARWLVQIAAIAAHLYDADELVVDYNKLAALNSREQLEYLHGQLIVVGVLPPGSALEHFRGFVDVYKANLRAVYSGPKDALPARVTIFRSRDLQPGQLVAETADSVRSAPLLGWDRCVSGELDVKTVDGDHLTMMRVPQVKSLATAIDEKILTHP